MILSAILFGHSNVNSLCSVEKSTLNNPLGLLLRTTGGRKVFASSDWRDFEAPVIAVSATGSCDAERLPWGELSS